MNKILNINGTKIIHFYKNDELNNEFIHQFIELYLTKNEYFGYENENVTVNCNDIVIDCGANMGLFSNWAASKNAKRVYSFEPGKTAFELLKENSQLYNNIDIFNCALGSNNYLCNYIECINIGGSHLSQYNLNKEAGFFDEYKVPVIALDSLFQNQKIDFIKIDCEGAEADILLGAKNIINIYSPKIVMACYHFYKDNKRLKNFLLSINPKYNIIEEQNKLFCWVDKN